MFHELLLRKLLLGQRYFSFVDLKKYFFYLRPLISLQNFIRRQSDRANHNLVSETLSFLDTVRCFIEFLSSDPWNILESKIIEQKSWLTVLPGYGTWTVSIEITKKNHTKPTNAETDTAWFSIDWPGSSQ